MADSFNGNFEADTPGNGNIPAGWTSYGDAGLVYKGVANDFASKGSQSFKISNTAVADSGIKIQISNIPIRSRVTLRVRVKTDALVDNATVVLDTAQDGIGGAQTSNNNQLANVNNDIYVTIPSIDATKVNIFLGIGSFGATSDGTAWFDDVQLIVGQGFGNYPKYIRVENGMARNEGAR